MSSVDERPVAAGGGAARPLLAADRAGLVPGLWDERSHAAAAQLRRVVDELGLERVRIGFVDQHGIVHGKTVTRAALGAALRSGITAPSSLLVKDTAGRSVLPVFGPGAGPDRGASDVVLVPDPTTFRVLPFSPGTGWLLADVYRPDGVPHPFCTRGLLRRELHRLATAGYALTIGVELEFHVLTLDGAPVTSGSQLLHEEGMDAHDDLVRTLHDGLAALDLPVRTLELEFGPGQFEITLDAADAARAADDVVLARAAIRQLCRRAGRHATFMSRPGAPPLGSAGWHLHQSLSDRAGRAVFDPGPGEDLLSATGRSWLGGLLAHAAAATAFTTPTVNGYKRYLPNSLAPDRIGWGVDDKGAMVRVVPARDGAGARIENRAPEPAANPYLAVATQIACGLSGLAAGRDPGPPLEGAYSSPAPPLPRSLGEALDALAADPVLTDAWGAERLAWWHALKRAEFDRYLAHVSDWERTEYLTLL